MADNGDQNANWTVNGDTVVGLGSFHKTLPHNEYGEVDATAFGLLKAAAAPASGAFDTVSEGPMRRGELRVGKFTNPRAGLAVDPLIPTISNFSMPPAPGVFSQSTAAEMVELYWMAMLRDVSLDKIATDPRATAAKTDVNTAFSQALPPTAVGDLRPGLDLPNKPTNLSFQPFTTKTLFRVGLPGEDVGPLISQFFIRDIAYGAQFIVPKVRPYRAGKNYLTNYNDWLAAQNSGNGTDFNDYPKSNDAKSEYLEAEDRVRYISTMRDLARFVNKDALHQAYFNAAIILLSSNAKWTQGNPYRDGGPLAGREAGFGTLGGPHILALVSEVATRALEIVWFQKWQTNLRLRPEAFAGLVHLKKIGVPLRCEQTVGGVTLPVSSYKTRGYDVKSAVLNSEAIKEILKFNQANDGENSLLLPMAFTAGSPVHPAYGAGHATVAGACVTVLKAFFQTLDGNNPVPLSAPADKCDDPAQPSLCERSAPYQPRVPFKAYETGVDANGFGYRNEISSAGMTIEGELNKLAMNVAMGRSMGGVHWRSDNTRSLVLGEFMSAHILSDITKNVFEHNANGSGDAVKFRFRTFRRKANGKPKVVVIAGGVIKVDGVKLSAGATEL